LHFQLLQDWVNFRQLGDYIGQGFLFTEAAQIFEILSPSINFDTKICFRLYLFLDIFSSNSSGHPDRTPLRNGKNSLVYVPGS
jgi:hypothetical protein